MKSLVPLAAVESVIRIATPKEWLFSSGLIAFSFWLNPPSETVWRKMKSRVRRVCGLLRDVHANTRPDEESRK